MFRSPFQAGFVFAFGSIALMGCGSPTVLRMMDGREVEGPFISDGAYFLYARASNAEARGELGEALLAYEQASMEDTESPAAWTGIGRIRCRLKQSEDTIREAFQKAEELDQNYAPLWKARTECARDRGRLKAALVYADKALSLDPNDEATVLMHAALYEKSGREKAAFAELHELVIRKPASLQAQLAMKGAAERMKKGWAVEASERALSSMARGGRVVGEGKPKAGPMNLDHLLIEGDIEGARKEGRRLKMDLSEVALRALLVGRAREGRELAELVALSDPLNMSAWMAYAVGADLERNEQAYERALNGMAGMGPGGRMPTKLASLLFTELLERRVGVEAARGFLKGATWKEHGDGDDARVEAVSARVMKKVGGGK